MSAEPESQFQSKPALFLLTIGFLIFLVYSNTLNASWHLDDYHIIPQNPGVRISDLSISSLVKAITADPYTGERLYRPVSMLSFALNWYLHQNSLPGYHLVSIAVHILTTFMLFYVIRELFKTPRLRHTSQEGVRFISWVTVLLWALNPVQVQAVTYIVQRMTSLAALFYVIAIWCFLRGRMTPDPVKRALIWVGCAVMYLLAIGSKENAITLPISLVAFELLFFPHSGFKLTRPKTIAVLVSGSLALGGLTAVLIYSSRGSIWTFLADLYARRPFTLEERLLTEPRILWHYISLLFYPVPQRLSIEYDIAVSTSFLTPWTTLPALLCLVGLLIAGIGLARSRPLVSLAVLFFLINQIPESTILPLELVFEHRNYLPSMFLFLPVAAVLKDVIDHYRASSKVFAVALAVCGALLIVAFGSGTYIRNMAWATEKSLWQDAQRKAPQSPRPLVNLSAKYYEKIGRVDLGVALNHEALRLSEGQPRQFKALCLKNIGNYHYSQGDYAKALSYYDKALTQDSAFVEAILNRNRTLLKLGRMEEALAGINKLIEEKGKNERFLELKGLILVARSNFADALKSFRNALSLAPYSRKVLLDVGACLNLMGYSNQAGFFFGRCVQLYPNDPMAVLWDVENLLRMNRVAPATDRVDAWIQKRSIDPLMKALESDTDYPSYFPTSFKLARSLVAERLCARSNRLSVASRR